MAYVDQLQGEVSRRQWNIFPREVGKKPTNCKVLNKSKETKGALSYLCCMSPQSKWSTSITQSHFHQKNLQAAVKKLSKEEPRWLWELPAEPKASRAVPVHGQGLVQGITPHVSCPAGGMAAPAHFHDPLQAQSCETFLPSRTGSRQPRLR